MESLSDAYENRSRATGVRGLIRRLRGEERAPSAPPSGSTESLRHPWLGRAPLRWFWFAAPSHRHRLVGKLLVFAILLDTLTTEVLLATGKVIEGNGVMRTAHGSAGPLGVIGVKVLILVLGVLIFRVTLGEEGADPAKLWFYGVCGVGWLLGGVWNVFVGVLIFT